MEGILLPRLAPVNFFPWTFFGYLLGFGAVTILFIFYFNRALAYILTLFIRGYLWHYYRSSITIEAIQVSPLAGRIFVKNVRYCARNEIISIAGCYITWKYWSRHVLRSEIFDLPTESPADTLKDDCNHNERARAYGQFMDRLSGKTYPRVMLDVRGLEWFVFNRTPAYDAVLAAVCRSTDRPQTSQSQAPGAVRINPSTIHPSNIHHVKSGSEDKEYSTDSAAFLSPIATQDTNTSLSPKQNLPSFLRTFPIGVICKKAAMVMGNNSTTSILVATSRNAEGLIDARKSGPNDNYKQCFDFVLESLLVKFRKNEDYTEDILAIGDDARSPSDRPRALLPVTHIKSGILHKLYRLVPHLHGSLESLVTQGPDRGVPTHAQHTKDSQGKWLGLSRYLDADEDEFMEHERWKSVEYAQTGTIVECPKVAVSFFWDVPGQVHSQSPTTRSTASKVPLYHINSDSAPEWGFDINITGGTINYGPWADRQRANLQNVFFPNSYASAVPASSLQAGQQRQSTQFKINITLDDAVNLRLYTRENTKDWKWKNSLAKATKIEQGHGKKTNRKKHEKAASDADVRSAGWLYLTAAANTSITYTMDMLASATGFGNELKVDIPSIHLTTSVNHGTFMRCNTMVLNCDLSNPLQWNKLRTWLFNITALEVEMFFLRDHAFLLIDLIDDWTSGPPNDFMTFTPFLYKFNIDLRYSKVYLNVNDANIIDAPASMQENAYLLFGAEKISTLLNVPAINYRPQRNAISFNGDIDNLYLELLSPTWSTLHSLLKQKRVGRVSKMNLRGCYDYCTSTSPAQTDILTLDLQGDALVLHVYGFLIRQFMTFRENFFGDDMHFQTLEEYQQRTSGSRVDVGTRTEHSSAKLSNDLDVILTVKASNSCLIIPSGIYSAERHIRADIDSVGLDLRFTNYYMDLDVSFSPISFTNGLMAVEDIVAETQESNTQVYLDGLWLSGHRLFGLPPSEPTYVCDWDFVVGALTGECSLEFLASLSAGVRAIGFQFRDVENALPRNQPKTIHDVTFLRVKIEPTNLWVHVQDCAAQIRTASSTIKFNDLAGDKFSEGLQAQLPEISIGIVNAMSAARQQGQAKRDVITYALLQTSVSICTVETAARFRAQRQLQQGHILKHDSRTHRTPWLLSGNQSSTLVTEQDHSIKPRPPTLPIPPMPEPVGSFDSENKSLSSFSTNGNSRSISNRRRSSFLSLTGSDRHTRPSPSRSISNAPINGRSQPRSFSRSSSRFAGRLSRIAFSSPYDTPHFPLQGIQPDTKDLPDLKYKDCQLPTFEFSETDFEVAEDQIVRSTVIISFGQGVTAFLTPEALICINQVLQAMQPSRPVQVLDNIQMSALPRVGLGFNRPKAIKSTQIRLDLPQVAVRIITQSTISAAPFEWQTYEAGISNLTLMIQVGSKDALKGSASAALAVRASAEALKLAVRGQQSDSMGDEARVQLNIVSTSGWLHSDGNVAGEIVSERFEIISLNRKVEYLSAIVNNAMSVLEEALPQFHHTSHAIQVREQGVVHFLSGLHQDLADPTFLNNASYIARATTEHARNSDTWKIISRLRYIFYNLSISECKELEKLFSRPESVLASAQIEEVVNSLKQWRGWDLEYLRTNAFMRQVFKTYVPHASAGPSQSSFSLGMSLTTFVVVVDPGPSQNQIQLRRIGLSADSLAGEPPKQPKAIARRTTSLTFSCDETVVQLNWEILEFVEGVLKRLNNSRTDKKSGENPVNLLRPPSPTRSEHHIHIITGFETIDIGFRTINLETTALTRSLRSSTMIQQSESSIAEVNSIVNAEFSVTKISSNTQLILVFQLLEPTLHGSMRMRRSAKHDRQVWTGGALCQKLELEVRQDPLGLLGIADALFRDEAAYIRSFAAILGDDDHNDRKSEKVENPIFSPTSVKNEFHAALLVEDYRVSIALLSSLHYVLHGNVARSTVQSVAGNLDDLKTSFDVKQHVHTFENHTQGSIDEITSLFLPPINGRINVTKHQSLFRADVAISLDKISLDASAVHALMSTLSRREVSSYQENVKRDIAILESNFTSLFPRKKPSKVSKQDSLRILYKVALVAEGLNVVAVTAKTSKQPARLILDIGPVFIDLENEGRVKGTALPFFEANADVKEIKILLERSMGAYFNSCGDVFLGFSLHAGSSENEHGKLVRSVEVSTTGPEINIYAETAPTIVDILGYVQQRFRAFSLSEELYSLRARRNRAKSIGHPAHNASVEDIVEEEDSDTAAALFNSTFSVEIFDIQVAWRVGELQPISPGHDVEDLIFSIEKTSLATRHANSAKLVMANLQLQMVPTSQSTKVRSPNSALMPEVLFNVAYVSTSKDRRFAFQAIGKSVDLRMTPQFVLPAADLQRSIALATQDLRKVIAGWNTSFIQDEQNKKIIAAKKISSILIDADFAGAIVNLQATGDPRSPISPYSPTNIDRRSNKVEQTIDCGRTSAILKTPGIAFKVEYSDLTKASRALNAEIKIDASSNTLQPSIVPLILELTNSIREIVHEKDDGPSNAVKKNNSSTSENEIMSNPVAVLGDCKLNLGLRICRQKFGLSCQPIAKVEARAEFENIYITSNTVQANEQDRFLTVSAKIQNLQASVQHTYSQEATGKFVAEYIELSLMNSRHVSDVRGISAILSFGPMKVLLNVRQLHDFLLFREIWLPEELKQSQPSAIRPVTVDEPQGFMMQRYQQVATASPFPWDATIAIADVDVKLDLGQSLGKSSFQITKFWTASKKISNWEQNLHLGFEKIKLDCAGRLNCYLGLENMALRTAIKWPQTSTIAQQIPLVQASMGFDDLKIKASFEYQAFLVGNFSSLRFLMYNVREENKGRDRLVCTVDGDKIQAYCTTQSSASALALHQAVERLILEKKQSFENSLKEIQRYYRRSKIGSPDLVMPRRVATDLSSSGEDIDRTPLQLQTNVVITLKLLNVGVYPRSFADSTIFKLDALDAQARFSVVVKDSTIQSSLGMSLGQVRIALSNINRNGDIPSVEEMSIDEVVKDSTGSRGGTILKVPRVNAGMQTWQILSSRMIEYIFRSSFEGKVEVGWNINRINVIRTMLNAHSKALASRLGKALPQSAVQITGVPTDNVDAKRKQDKITAVVNVPLSKYSYTALEPPIIETPQLRDMGEATPPLEWIGLQRDRLPNLTHQIIIVPLLEVAKEVEDAYGSILGAS